MIQHTSFYRQVTRFTLRLEELGIAWEETAERVWLDSCMPFKHSAAQYFLMTLRYWKINVMLIEPEKPKKLCCFIIISVTVRFL